MHAASYGTRLRQARSESELRRTGLGALLGGPGALPQALRSVSASLLTDLTALDLDTLDRTLEFLANNEAQIETQVLPGDEQAGRYTLNEESLAAVQSFFNVSPTDGQASSASEP